MSTKRISQGLSKIYETTFKDGTKHYMRMDSSRNYTAKTYVSHTLSMAKQRNTEFEKRFAKELKTLKVRIVFEGPTDEAIKVKKQLIANSEKVFNSKVRETGTIKTKTLTLKSQFIKKLVSGGSTIYFIDNEYGCRMGLKAKMGGMFHPFNKNFIKLNAQQINLV